MSTRSIRLTPLSRAETPALVRHAGLVVAVALVTTGLISLAAPWQQTAKGEGRVLAFSPTDRPQQVEAPVKGRVVQWHVVEGSRVEAGDLLVEIRDVDPNYVVRLGQERDAIAARKAADEAQAEAYEGQVAAYLRLKEMGLRAAERKIEMAAQKVLASRRKLEAEEASLKAAEINRRRVRQLSAEGLASSRDEELAELAAARAQTSVGAAMAALAEAEAAKTAMEAERLVKQSEAEAKAASSRGSARKALADAAKAAAELTKLDVQLARQSSRRVVAPRSGIVLELSGGQGAEIVKEGDRLAVIVPDTESRAVELWLDGNDVPLVSKGRKVRLQFEGWPAVQFAGWPSVAVGTFGGEVALVDAQSRRGGQFRALVVPDADDEPWPESAYLRQGGRAKGWVMLDEVRLGYELWRRANGFPPTATADPKKGTKK